MIQGLHKASIYKAAPQSIIATDQLYTFYQMIRALKWSFPRDYARFFGRKRSSCLAGRPTNNTPLAGSPTHQLDVMSPCDKLSSPRSAWYFRGARWFKLPRTATTLVQQRQPVESTIVAVAEWSTTTHPRLTE
jgi:hypothetical protein